MLFCSIAAYLAAVVLAAAWLAGWMPLPQIRPRRLRIIQGGRKDDLTHKSPSR
jgi:hypothetical protein